MTELQMAEASPWNITVVILSCKWHLRVDIHIHPLVSVLAQTSKIFFRVYTKKKIFHHDELPAFQLVFMCSGVTSQFTILSHAVAVYTLDSYIFDVFPPLFWQCKTMLLVSAILHITWVIKRDLKNVLPYFFLWNHLFSPCQANIGTAQQINPFSMATTALPSKLKQQSIITLRHEGQSVWKKAPQAPQASQWCFPEFKYLNLNC